jgi:transposase
MTKPYSLDLRDRAVARVVAGETVRSVAATLRVGVSSVVKWAQRFRATGSAAPRKMGGHRPRVLIGEHRAWLLQQIASGLDMTLRGLVAELAEQGVKVSYRTVWNFVHRANISYKKGVFPTAQNHPPIARVPHRHWKTSTFVAAPRRDGIEAPCVVAGPINGARFLAYLEPCLVPTLRPGDIVCLDNLASHQSKAGRDAICAAGAKPLPAGPFARSGGD